MANCYDKYFSIYGKSLEEIPDSVWAEIKTKFVRKQSQKSLASVIAYNEEKQLAACLWSDLPYFNETQQSPGFARQCGLEYAKDKYHFCIDVDIFYWHQYVNLMMTKLEHPDVSCVSSFMSQLMGDAPLRMSMSLVGQRKACRFGIEQIAERWKNIYEFNENQS